MLKDEFAILPTSQGLDFLLGHVFGKMELWAKMKAFTASETGGIVENLIARSPGVIAHSLFISDHADTREVSDLAQPRRNVIASTDRGGISTVASPRSSFSAVKGRTVTTSGASNELAALGSGPVRTSALSKPTMVRSASLTCRLAGSSRLRLVAKTCSLSPLRIAVMSL